MPKLPFIGGIAGIFGLVLEFSNLKSPTSLISKNRTPFKLRRCVLYSIVREAELTVKKEEEASFSKEINDDALWSQVNRDCMIKERIFLAKKGGKWVYEERQQTLNWKIN